MGEISYISVEGLYLKSFIYTRLTLALPLGERRSTGAEHDGILPTPLPALPQPPPPAHQGRTGRRSQDLCQDQWQQVWGLHLEPEWQVTFKNSRAGGLLCRGCRIKEEGHPHELHIPTYTSTGKHLRLNMTTHHCDTQFYPLQYYTLWETWHKHTSAASRGRENTQQEVDRLLKSLQMSHLLLGSFSFRSPHYIWLKLLKV